MGKDIYFDNIIGKNGQSLFEALADIQAAIAAVQAETEEIEHHFHNEETWVGISADQSGNDWAADTLNPFMAISGAGVYGADPNDEAKVLGTLDTPVRAGMTKFDMRRVQIVNATSSTQYKMRFIWGIGAQTMAQAIVAEQYTEFMTKRDSASAGAAAQPIDIIIPRLDAGVKVWAQCKNATNNATISFFVGLHEYLE